MNIDDVTIEQVRAKAQELGLSAIGKSKRDLLVDIGAVLVLKRTRKPKEEKIQEYLYFGEDASLTEQEKKYCRCIMHVAAKQSDWCLKQRAWGERRGNKTCYQPWSVCTKSTKRRAVVECSKNFDFSRVPDD